MKNYGEALAYAAILLGLWMCCGCASVRTQDALDRAEFCEAECCCTRDREARPLPKQSPVASR